MTNSLELAGAIVAIAMGWYLSSNRDQSDKLYLGSIVVAVVAVLLSSAFGAAWIAAIAYAGFAVACSVLAFDLGEVLGVGA